MVLKVVTTATTTNGTVTIIGGTANQINVSPNPITATGNIALANITTAGTYGNASTVAQVVIDATGRVTSASNVAISIANSAVTGLGTMATQNANAVAITGGNTSVTYDNAVYQIATANIAASSNAGAYSYGNISYSDIGLVATYANTANNSVQIVMQNQSGGSNASTDIVITNNTSVAYVDIGIASPTYSGGGGGLNTANVGYVYAGSTDLYVGTSTNNAVHFLANNGSTDAMVVNGNNTVTINAYAGTTNANATFNTSSLQLVPLGYLVLNINGTNYKIPYYNA
jgi:hypothetical protein